MIASILTPDVINFLASNFWELIVGADIVLFALCVFGVKYLR